MKGRLVVSHNHKHHVSLASESQNGGAKSWSVHVSRLLAPRFATFGLIGKKRPAAASLELFQAQQSIVAILGRPPRTHDPTGVCSASLAKCWSWRDAERHGLRNLLMS